MKARVIAGAAAAALITLVAAEIALRLAGLIPLSSGTYIPDPETGFKLRPSAITDEDGFNNPRTDAEPAPARIAAPGTVVFVGDSFAFGTYPADSVFPALVAADLATEGLAARAVNLGIPGAGPDTYVHVMRGYLPRLKPDAVVATIYLGNDVEQGDPKRPTKLWLGRIGNYGDPLSLDPDDLMIVAVAGKLFRLAEEAWYSRYAPEYVPTEPDEAGRRSLAFSPEAMARVRWHELEAARVKPDARIAHGYDGLAGHLKEMAAIARQNKAKFLVALAPSRVEIDAGLRTQVVEAFGGDPKDFDGALPARRVGEILTALGIPFVDLTPALVAAGPAHVYNHADTHWNRRGNAVAAAAIADALKPLLASP
jgi:lysophospholipase L1-like esterase